MSATNLIPRNADTEQYDGDWESQHRILLIVVVSLAAASILLIPATYFTLRALRARAAKKKTAKLFVERPSEKRRVSDSDSESEWTLPSSRPVAPRPLHADPERGAIRETLVDRPESMHAVDLSTPIRFEHRVEEKQGPKGMWEKIAAKRKSGW